MRCDDWRDQSAFAVANEPDSLGVQILAGFQISDCGLSIAGEVLDGGIGVVAGGLASAALIKTQSGNPLARQMVGQDQERAMPLDGFIAIARSVVAKEDGDGEWPRALRKCKST